MKPRIGLIASQPMAQFIKGLERDLSDRCEILYLIAESSEDVLELYQDNLENVDIFLFSGRLFYLTLLDRGVYPEKIFYIFNEFEGDIKGILLEQLIADRSIDLSRIFIDVAFAENNYLGIKDLLPPEERPLCSEDARIFTNRDYGRHLFDYHKSLHEQDRIDLSITGVGTLVKHFEAQGIPYRYFYPTREYVLNFIIQILTSRPASQTNIPAAIMIQPEIMDEERISRCVRQLRKRAKESEMEVSIRHEATGLLVMTNLTNLHKLTHGFNDLSFKKVLEESTGALYIGFGSGKNQFHARLNASTALSTGMSQQGKVYYATLDNELIGPLGSRHIESYQQRPTKQILEMSKTYHVDHQNIQKLLNYTAIIDSDTFSAIELSQFMEITVRSASRLMNRIIEHGGATSYMDKTKRGRGRPVKLYKLIW